MGACSRSYQPFAHQQFKEKKRNLSRWHLGGTSEGFTADDPTGESFLSH
jgi:hypothetical protein